VLSAEQNHTPDGSRSLSTRGFPGFAYASLPADTDLAIEAWLYDSADPDAYGGIIAAPGAPTNPAGCAEFGVFPSSQYGGAGGGSARYTYYLGTGDWARQDSGIPRSRGWHKVTIRVTPAGGSISFDGRLVASGPAVTRVRKLYLGNPWAGVKPMYFDDLSVNAISE
jgi:hypothetical protein